MIGVAAPASWSISSSVSASPCSASCHWNPNSASGPNSPVCSASSRLGPLARLGQLDLRGDVAVEVARPEHVDPGLLEGGDAGVEQADELVGVEGQLVGHAQLEEPLEHRPGVGGGSQRDAGVGARPVAEAVAGVETGLGPQHGGVADVGGVLGGVDLEDDAYGAGDQLLLVGLDPQRDRDELGPVVTRPRAGPGDPLLQSPGEVGIDAVGSGRGLAAGDRRTTGRDRRGARHRVGHRVEHGAHDPLGGRRVEPGVRPRGGELGDPVLVGPLERGHLPRQAARVGPELAGRHQPHPQQGGAAQQRHARVQVVAVCGPW